MIQRPACRPAWSSPWWCSRRVYHPDPRTRGTDGRRDQRTRRRLGDRRLVAFFRPGAVVRAVAHHRSDGRRAVRDLAARPTIDPDGDDGDDAGHLRLSRSYVSFLLHGPWPTAANRQHSGCAVTATDGMAFAMIAAAAPASLLGSVDNPQAGSGEATSPRHGFAGSDSPLHSYQTTPSGQRENSSSSKTGGRKR